MRALASKNAATVAYAAPSIKRGVKAMSAAQSPTLAAEDSHCVTVLKTGLPSAVRQADEVCTSDCVTAHTDIILTSRIRIVRSPSDSAPKMIFAARGAKKYSPSAIGRDTARVMPIAFIALALAAAKSPLSARGAICGTPEAASP